MYAVKQEMFVPNNSDQTYWEIFFFFFLFSKSQQKNKYSAFRFHVPNSEAVKTESDSNLKAQEDFDLQSSC